MTAVEHDSNARLVELLVVGLRRADEEGRARVPLKLFSSDEQHELLTLLHAYLWDTAAPHNRSGTGPRATS
jgi:3'-phosphoadenosine 5'-phosphosulfate sulfotransferase (PAPS reductase)/FAD synthetase